MREPVADFDEDFVAVAKLTDARPLEAVAGGEADPGRAGLSPASSTTHGVGCECAHCSAPVDESTIRLAIYASEADELYRDGWNVAMRHDPVEMSVTADISGHGRERQRCTVLRVPEGTIGEYAIRNAQRIARLAGRPFKWSEPIPMDSVMFLVFWCAFRDHYEGKLPHGWPLKNRSNAA